MGILVAIPVIVAGVVGAVTAPDPFGWWFDAGLASVLGGLLALPIVTALRLRRTRRAWSRWSGGALLGLTAVCAIAGIVAAVDYRLVVFRRGSVSAWQKDLVVLRGELEKLPAGLRARSRAVTEPALADLEASLAVLDEDQRQARLIRAIAGLSDGHSVHFPFFPSTDFSPVPLRIRPFADGWFVIDTASGLRHLRGARILRLGALDAEAAFQAMRPFVSADNESAARVRAAVYMLSPRLWNAIGQPVPGHELTLEVQDTAGLQRTVTVRTTSRLRYAWWYLDPLHLREWRRPWTVRAIPHRSALHLQLRAVRHDGDKTLGMLAADLLAAARAGGLGRLVIDVRGNSGGDNTTFRRFVETLAASEFNARGRLFVLTDPWTFSAATNLVSTLERRTRAVLVGEPTGSGPNHHGDSTQLILPNTRTFLLLSTRFHEFGAPDDRRTAHEPHVLVRPTSVDYFNGRDAVLETALNWR